MSKSENEKKQNENGNMPAVYQKYQKQPLLTSA
jgi:hypothetical protein